MRSPTYTTQFHRDLKRSMKRGKEIQKLKDILSLLIEEKKLPEKNRDHKLIGPFKDFRECHIEPDWLLLYQICGHEIIFIRTGSHSDLFD